jgi:uncharacterized protein (TIGR02117 family)
MARGFTGRRAHRVSQGRIGPYPSAMPRICCTLRVVVLLAATAVGACAAPASHLCPAPPEQPAEVIFVVSHGWHAGLVLPSRAAAVADWPLGSASRRAEQVEIGWGERDYYMTSDPGWWLAVKAVLLPNESVLHLVWLNAPLEELFPRSEILEIQLSAVGMERLSRYIGDSFARNDHGLGIDLGAGRYGDSRFYLSRERYHAFNTCNVWVARALRAAGCPISPVFALTVKDLMGRMRPFATQVHADSGR